MKCVIQCVLNSNVRVNEELISSIDRGFLILSGYTFGDDKNVVKKMAQKISKLRVFADENGKTNLSLKDIGGEILSVSQFTLYADVKSGNRPSFTKAMPGKDSKDLYEYFNSCLKEEGFNVKEGIFGADMKVSLVNDGPFTVIINSEDL